MNEASGEFSRPLPIEAVIDIASAIAERDFKEVESVRSIVGNITDGPMPAVPAAAQQKVMAARTAVLIQHVENPSKDMSTEDALELFLGGGGDEELATSIFGESDVDVSGGQLRDWLGTFSKAVSGEIDPTAAGEEADFMAKFQAAKVIAAKRNVTIADVYRDDELYRQMFQEAYTPESFALRQIATINGINERSFSSLAVKMAEDIIPEFARSLMSDEELSELIASIQLDPAFQQVLTEQVQNMRGLAQRTAAVKIAEMWGEDTLDKLSPNIRQSLGLDSEASLDLSTSLGGLALEQPEEPPEDN